MLRRLRGLKYNRYQRKSFCKTNSQKMQESLFEESGCNFLSKIQMTGRCIFTASNKTFRSIWSTESLYLSVASYHRKIEKLQKSETQRMDFIGVAKWING